MYLKQVTEAESKIAWSYLLETAEWFKTIGSLQWSDILDGQDRHGLKQAIERGEVFFFYINEECVGMVAAWKNPSAWDKMLWKEYNHQEQVCYLHRVIIRPTYRNKGYGKELLTALKEKFKEEVSALRLDCLASNQHLVDFYKRNEFKNIGYSLDTDKNKFELFTYYFDK